MPAWPASLPTKAIAGTHRFAPQPNVVAFQPDVGRPILRRRYMGRSASESFTLRLTKDQADRLYEFWAIDCAQGALEFDAPLIDGLLRRWWFDPQNPPDWTNIRGGTAYEINLTMGCRR